jgi:hypothetical protein
MIGTTAMIVAAVVISAAAAAASATASIKSGQAQRAAANYNAAVAKNNATMARQQSEYDAQRIRDRNRRLAASQAAIYGKSGVDITSGSAADVIYDSAIQGEFDALAALYSGRTQAASQTSRAQLLQFEGQTASNAGTMSAIGASLQGASNATSLYANYNLRK